MCWKDKLARMSRRKYFNRQRPNVIVVSALILSLGFGPIWTRPACAGSVASTAPASAATAKLDNIFNALQESEAAIPRDTFDPNAVVAKTGLDATKIFEWVRDQTFYVPYRGSLRGATGVLMDRVGNSLDRALCLAELLRRAGYAGRLVNAQLADTDAEALLLKIRPLPALPYGADSQSAQSDEDQARLIAKYGLDVAGAQRAVEANTAQAMSIASAIVQRATDQSPLLISAVGKPKAAPDDHPRDVAAVKDFWWVQVQQGSVWKDLDPTPMDARFGAPGQKPARTIAPDAKSGRFVLEPALLHLVKIRIVAEKWENGKLSENALLEQEIRPADVIGKQITFTNVPTKWPAPPDKSQPDGGVSFLSGAATDVHEWLPLLCIGDQRIAHDGVNDAGMPTQSLANASGADQMGRGIGGAFGGALNAGTGANKQKPESFLTAEWIDYEIATPGGAVRKIRRGVFDWLGPAARKAVAVPKPDISADRRIARSLALNGVVEILPQACRLSPEYCSDLTFRRLLTSRSAYVALATTPDLDTSHMLALTSKIASLPGATYDLAQLRWACSPVAGDVYLDRINLVALGTHLQVSPGGISGVRQFDIVANDVAVRPASSAGGFSVRVMQGVTDTNAEALLLKTTEMGPVRNAGESLNKIAGAKNNLAVVAKADDPILSGDRFSADISTRLLALVSAGNVVVVSGDQSSKDQVDWWCIDPTTGQTLGMGPAGAGQAAVEQRVLDAVKGGLAVEVLCLATYGYAHGNIPKEKAAKCFATGIGAAIALFKGPASMLVTGAAILAGFGGGL